MTRNAFAYFLTFFLLSSPLQASRTFEVHALTSLDKSEVSIYSSPHLLRDAGIDINSVDFYDQTPLFHACEKAYIETADFLLNCDNIKPDLVNKVGKTPFGAAAYEYYACYRELDELETAQSSAPFSSISHNRRVEIKNALLAQIARYEKIIDLCIEKGRKRELSLNQGLYYFFEVRQLCKEKKARKNYFEELLAIQPTIINAHVEENYQRTLLHHICLTDNSIESLNELLAIDQIDIGRKDSSGMTAFLYVITSPSPEAVEALVKHKESILDELDAYGYPPVLTAYKSMVCFSSPVSSLLLCRFEKIIAYLLAHRHIDIPLITRVIKKKKIVFTLKNEFCRRVKKMIKDKILYYYRERDPLLCTGYLRRLCNNPINLQPISSIVIPFFKESIE